MPDKIMKNLDNYGRYNLFGVYQECKDDITLGIAALPRGTTRIKTINYRVFSKVVRMYFTIAFKMLINGSSLPLLNKFGILRVVKTKCIRYNPFRIAFYKDKTGKVIRKKVKLETKSGYWFFVFWDSPKSFRQYRFNIDIKYKRAYMKLVKEGYDFLDYTLDGYGRNASTDYIQHIK